MKERLEKEVALLQKQYPAVRHDQNLDWVIVEDLPLPDEYNRDTTGVLIFVPSGYPETPPDNFWVPSGLRLANDGQPDAFNPSHRTHEGEEWDRFSWHEDDGWAPSEDVEDGSNLLTFMQTVEKRLKEAE